jgi:hypothetical protein
VSPKTIPSANSDDAVSNEAISSASKLQLCSCHTDWFKPSLWKVIDVAAHKTSFCANEMVALLQKQLGGESTFCTLAGSTIQHWMDITGPTQK